MIVMEMQFLNTFIMYLNDPQDVDIRKMWSFSSTSRCKVLFRSLCKHVFFILLYVSPPPSRQDNGTQYSPALFPLYQFPRRIRFDIGTDIDISMIAVRILIITIHCRTCISCDRIRTITSRTTSWFGIIETRCCWIGIGSCWMWYTVIEVVYTRITITTACCCGESSTSTSTHCGRLSIGAFLIVRILFANLTRSNNSV